MADVVTANLGPLQLVDPPLPRSADPYWVYLDTLASGESQRTMRRCLDAAAWHVLAGASFSNQANPPIRGLVTGENRAWWAIRYEHVAMVKRGLLLLELSPSTINTTLSALRQVLRTCWRLEYLSGDAYQRLRDIEPVKGSREPAGRNIHPDELAALLEVCLSDQTPAGIRDAALMATLYSTGMRRAEAAAADVADYDPRERGWRIIGKGNKQRTVYVSQDAFGYVERWLVTLGSRRGPAFRRIDRWGNIGAEGLTPGAINRIMDRRRILAELSLLSPHDVRHTFGGAFLDAGGDLSQLQRAMGHASQTTTAKYDRRPGRQIRDVVDRMQINLGGEPE
jgi:site-specific recombinase XerD